MLAHLKSALEMPNTNPTDVCRDAMRKRRRGRFPGLTDPRAVGRLMADTRAWDQGEPQVRAGLRLSAYLFQRNTEMRGWARDEIGWTNALREIPARRMNGIAGETAFDHIVPLPRQAIAILKELRQWTGHGKLVLPRRAAATGCCRT